MRLRAYVGAICASLCLFSVVRADPLTIDVIDVGLGEAILIGCPDRSSFTLIDAGDNDTNYAGAESRLRRWVTTRMGRRRQFYRSIATHPHPDHIAGFLPLFKAGFSSSLHIDDGSSFDGAEIEEELRAYLLQQGITNPHEVPQDFSVCPGSEVRTEQLLLSPANQRALGCPTDLNNCSIVLRIEYHGYVVLLLADATHAWERVALEEPTIRSKLRAHVLKVGHHASHVSTSEDFLKAVAPQYAVASVGVPGEGRSDTLGYPSAATITRINNYFETVRGKTYSNESVRACDRSEGKCNWTALPLHERLYVTAAQGTISITIAPGSLNVSPGEKVASPAA